MAHVRDVISGVYREESPEALQDDGIDVYLGAALLLDPNTITVGDATLTARRVLIVLGHGRAEKQQVVFMVTRLLALPSEPAVDAADVDMPGAVGELEAGHVANPQVAKRDDAPPSVAA